jgi:hypothetical protein
LCLLVNEIFILKAAYCIKDTYIILFTKRKSQTSFVNSLSGIAASMLGSQAGEKGNLLHNSKIFVVLVEFDTQTLLALHMKCEVPLMSDSLGENRILVAQKLRKWKAL